MNININTQEILDVAINMVTTYGPSILQAIIVWFIGMWVIKLIIAGFGKVMTRSKLDESIQSFLKSLVGILLKVMLGITVLTMLKIEMTGFIAILGAAGLAVGLALSGTLQNFAGGVMILLFKPFKVGDVVDAQGYTGCVKEIQIFNTIMTTPDNKTIILPNGNLSTSSMTNFSTEPKRRVDWTIGIAYGDDVDQARKVIKALCDADDRILKDPEVAIFVKELGASSVDFTVRAWVESADYWGVFFDMNENVYKSFPKEGLNIPFPQMDVHVHQTK